MNTIEIPLALAQRAAKVHHADSLELRTVASEFELTIRKARKAEEEVAAKATAESTAVDAND